LGAPPPPPPYPRYRRKGVWPWVLRAYGGGPGGWGGGGGGCGAKYDDEAILKRSSLFNSLPVVHTLHTDKKENRIFLIYKEIQMGSGAKLYIRKGFLIYEEIHKSFTINEEAVSHI
jgi:hypothetical protein